MPPEPVADVAAMRLRRTPRQARSRDKVARMLTAADRLLVEHGPESLTTTRVAAAAGVSVGALYQYLPDRDSIIDALAEVYLGRLEDLMRTLADRAAQERWPDPIAILLDAFTNAYRTQPGLRALWFGRHLTEQTRAADRRHKRLMATGLHRILLAQNLIGDDDRAAQSCYAAFLASDAIMQEAFRTTPTGDPALLAQLDTLMRAFLDRIGASEATAESWNGRPCPPT